MVHKIAIALIFLSIQFTCTNLSAQNQDLHYTFSYYGNNLWNEGFALSVEKLSNVDSLSNKRGKSFIKMKSHAVSIGMYNDSGSHTAMFISAGWQWRKITTSRWNWIYAVQPFGVYRASYPEAYKVNDDGSVNEIFLPGRNYLAPCISAGFGRMGRWNPKNGWQARIHLMTLLPYNKTILPLLNFELGYHFSIQSKKS